MKLTLVLVECAQLKWLCYDDISKFYGDKNGQKLVKIVTTAADLFNSVAPMAWIDCRTFLILCHVLGYLY